jgi:catechol 2,3-dioxygenase-like lactoylglutathione lyase family enzyme
VLLWLLFPPARHGTIRSSSSSSKKSNNNRLYTTTTTGATNDSSIEKRMAHPWSRRDYETIGIRRVLVVHGSSSISSSSSNSNSNHNNRESEDPAVAPQKILERSTVRIINGADLYCCASPLLFEMAGRIKGVPGDFIVREIAAPAAAAAAAAATTTTTTTTTTGAADEDKGEDDHSKTKKDPSRGDDRRIVVASDLSPADLLSAAQVCEELRQYEQNRTKQADAAAYARAGEEVQAAASQSSSSSVAAAATAAAQEEEGISVPMNSNPQHVPMSLVETIERFLVSTDPDGRTDIQGARAILLKRATARRTSAKNSLVLVLFLLLGRLPPQLLLPEGAPVVDAFFVPAAASAVRGRATGVPGAAAARRSLGSSHCCSGTGGRRHRAFPSTLPPLRCRRRDPSAAAAAALTAEAGRALPPDGAVKKTTEINAADGGETDGEGVSARGAVQTAAFCRSPVVPPGKAATASAATRKETLQQNGAISLFSSASSRRRRMLGTVGGAIASSVLLLASSAPSSSLPLLRPIQAAAAAVGTLPELAGTDAVLQGITVQIADPLQYRTMIAFLRDGFDCEIVRKSSSTADSNSNGNQEIWLGYGPEQLSIPADFVLPVSSFRYYGGHASIHLLYDSQASVPFYRPQQPQGGGDRGSNTVYNIAYVQLGVPQYRVSQMVASGGDVLDAYGYVNVVSPAGVPFRGIVGIAPDPVMFAAIHCADVATSRSFYRDVLGFVDVPYPYCRPNTTGLFEPIQPPDSAYLAPSPNSMGVLLLPVPGSGKRTATQKKKIVPNPAIRSLNVVYTPPSSSDAEEQEQDDGDGFDADSAANKGSSATTVAQGENRKQRSGVIVDPSGVVIEFQSVADFTRQVQQQQQK